MKGGIMGLLLCAVSAIPPRTADAQQPGADEDELADEEARDPASVPGSAPVVGGNVWVGGAPEVTDAFTGAIDDLRITRAALPCP